MKTRERDEARRLRREGCSVKEIAACLKVRQAAIETFWLSTLGLPRTCLLGSTVNAYSKHSRRERSNALPYGTCRLVVNDTRIVQTIFGSIQEIGGFRRDDWAA